MPPPPPSYPPPPASPPPGYPPPGSPPPSYPGPSAGGHPLTFELDHPLEMDRWRVFQFILAIPQLIVGSLLQQVEQFLALIAALAIIFTRKIPNGIFNFMVMTGRYGARTSSYAAFMRKPYPPFTFDMEPLDPGGDPVRYTLPQQPEYKRWAPIYKWFILIPWYIVGIVYGIGAIFVMIVAWFAVLFTAKWPAGMRDYVVKVMRYWYRVQSYIVLSDVRPAFSLQ
jgi:hypothetical protein